MWLENARARVCCEASGKSTWGCIGARASRTQSAGTKAGSWPGWQAAACNEARAVEMWRPTGGLRSGGDGVSERGAYLSALESNR